MAKHWSADGSVLLILWLSLLQWVTGDAGRKAESKQTSLRIVVAVCAPSNLMCGPCCCDRVCRSLVQQARYGSINAEVDRTGQEADSVGDVANSEGSH